jgi:hypothetical protein
MASLYKSSHTARKLLIGVVIFIIAVLAIDTISSFNSKNQINTTQRRFYMDPDNKFGDIKAPNIESIPLAEGSTPTYALRQSNLGTFPDVAYVYQIEKPGEKLGTYESVISRGEILGFPENTLSEEGRIMAWSSSNGSRSAEFGRDTFFWELKTDYTTNVEALRNKTISPQTALYGNNALTFLKKFVLNGDSYNYGFRNPVKTVTLANIETSGQFVEVDTAAEAEYARVDIYRQLPFADLKPQGQLPTLIQGEQKPVATTGVVYRTDPRVGIFTAIVSNNFTDYTKDIFALDFTDFNYTGATGKYFIITAAEAWTKIQNGEASLVAMETQDTDRFSTFPVANVRKFEADPVKTTLGYYESREWNGYVTPIYIVRGTATLEDGRLANFTFYVNALKERATT